MTVNNNDVIGDKCVKDKDNNLMVGDNGEMCVWKAHYEQLLNKEFYWDDGLLSIQPSVEGPAIKVTKEMVAEEILKIKVKRSHRLELPLKWLRLEAMLCYMSSQI